jgi:hypothetical protein
MEKAAFILWRQLDAEGHCACWLSRQPDGWSLDGTVVFDHEAMPCALNYTVRCDTNWRTHSASIVGRLGMDNVDLDIARDGKTWLLNGVEQPLAEGCLDLDLGFTPATNLLALRRLSLSVGDESPAPAAYLEAPTSGLVRLEQTYRRIDRLRYAYESPAFGYAEVLTVSDEGFVTDYPGLWQQVLLSERPD